MFDIAGVLSDGSLPTALRDIYVGRRSGVLQFSRGGETLSVHFVRGHILHGESGIHEIHLGELMVDRGLLSPADRAHAAAVVDKTKKRLGSVLVELGILDKGQLQDVLALHVREILLRAFTWTEGKYAFWERPEVLPSEYDITLKLSTGEMILEAARSLTNADAVRKSLGNADRRLVLSTDPLLRFQKITLTPADGFVVSRIDGQTTARELLKIIPLPPEEIERSLFGLLCTGVVEYLPTEIPEAPLEIDVLRREILEASKDLGRKTHFEVLGVPRYAPESLIRGAYLRLVKRYHPDAHHHAELADLRDRIDQLFSRVRDAYDTLRNPQARAAYEERLAQAARPAPPPPTPRPVDPEEEARRLEEILVRAEERFKERKFWEVVGLLEALVPLAHGRLNHRARLLLAQTYFKNPHWRREAEAEILGVLEEDPENSDARFALGEMYRDRGMRDKAIEAFREVLQARPKHKGAATELADLLGSDEGGLLKKLFGR